MPLEVCDWKAEVFTLCLFYIKCERRKQQFLWKKFNKAPYQHILTEILFVLKAPLKRRHIYQGIIFYGLCVQLQIMCTYNGSILF